MINRVKKRLRLGDIYEVELPNGKKAYGYFRSFLWAGLLGIREITEVNAVFDKSTVNPVFSKPDHINIKMNFDVKDYL